MLAASNNKMEVLSGLIIFSILAAIVAGLYFSFGGSKMRPWHYDDPPFLRSRSKEGDTVIVAREAGDVDKPLAAWAAGKQAEFSEMIHSERFFLVRDGTGVTVLERGAEVSKVKIRKDGREGYVYHSEIIAE